MRPTPAPQSATSLPRAPHEDERARERRYLLMMAIRFACILAMVVITPYGWYTWVLAIGAVFLPYIAVVGANVSSASRTALAEQPAAALPAPSAAAQAAPRAEQIEIVRIAEKRPDQDPLP